MAPATPLQHGDPLGLVVRALAELGAESPHTVHEVTQHLGVPRTTAHRALNRAACAGLVVHDVKLRAWLLSEVLRPRSHSPWPPRSPAAQRVEEALSALHSRTRHLVLLYEPARIAAPARRLVFSADGPGHRLSDLTAEQRAALAFAPLTADPAGWIIEACAIPGSKVRARGITAGLFSPMPGMVMTAVPVWSGPHVAGSLAVLHPAALPVAVDGPAPISERLSSALRHTAAILSAAPATRALRPAC